MPIRAPLAPSSPFAQALQQEEQIQAVNNQAAFEQDFIAKQQREQIAIQRQQESAAADAARQQKANLARAKKAGVKINTDADGNEQMATHEDGQPVYEAGFVGTPSMQGGKASAKYRDARGSSYDVPFEAIRSEQDPSGQTFYNFDVSGPDGKKQTMRQPEGTKPLFRVDKATGQRIADFADPATGSTQTAIVGLDPVAANAAAIQKRRDALQLRQNEISGAAEQLRLEQAAADTKFRPVAERFSAAEKAYEDVTKAKTRYEERVGADGKMAVHQIEDTSFGEQAMPLVDAPTIAKARAWMDQKKRVTTEYEAAKAERDPAKTALQTMQERRDQLALEHLSEKRRAEKEIRLMGEAAKKNYPVYEPEWQKRFLSILEDPRVQDNATIADLEDAGDPLAEDVKRVSRPASAAALNAALEAGIVSPDSPLVAFRTTDTQGMMEDAPRAKLVDTVASGLTAGKPVIATPDREPFPSELDYFKKNTNVAGMAAEDDKVILNPYATHLSNDEKEAVVRNERARIQMRNGTRPSFALTAEQRATFKGYGSEQDIRETVAARILSGDPSAGVATSEQKTWVEQNLKNLPFSPDKTTARALAAKSLGMQPDGVDVSEQKPEGHYELSRKGEVFATLDPRNNRLTLLDTPASLQDKGAEIIANASPDGVPVYMVSSQQPFRPGEVRDLIQEAIAAVSATKTDAEAKSALAAVGLDSAGIRQKVMDGKLSVQDGKLLNDKFNDVKQADMSAEGMRAGFGKWMAVNPVLAAKFQKGGAKEKAEVANFYADTVAAQAKSGIFRSNATMAASRQALVKQVGGGEEGSLWKDVTSGIKQAPGFLWNIAMSAPRFVDKYVVNPNDNAADTELWAEQTENFVNRLMVEKAPWKKDASPMGQVLGEVEAWADRADSVDDLPDEMADRLAEAAYTSYHGFKNDGIGGANVDTTRDTYNIKRDPVLRKMMQQYLDTGDASAFNSLGQMLKSNQDERNTDIKVNQYIERPRVATPLEIAARASLLNIQLDPAKAAAILALSKEGETVKDRAGVDDILKRAGQIMGLDPEQAEIAMSEITRAEVTDPDSWTGNFRASSVAPAHEAAAELVIDAALGMMTSTVVGAPEALALKAAQVGAKGMRASMGRFVAHNLDNLGARVPTFAKLRTAIGRGRAKMRADVDELAADYAGLGIQKPVFGSVLTAGQKISNAAVATSKAIVAGAPMEGLEESVVAMLSNDPSLENVTDSALMGALGVVGMVPAFAGVQGIRNAFTKRGQVKEWEKYKQGAINEINAFMGKSAPDFKPLTTADFDAMQAFAGRPVHQAAAQEYAKAQLVHKAEQAAFAEASQSGPAVPPPSLLAAQVRLKTAENSLGAFFTDAFMAADALRALPEAERPLYTAAAKAAAGVTDYTEAEAKALMQQSGDNAIAFQQAQVMPGDVAGPPAMRTTGAPEVTTAAPGVYRIPAGVKITLPPALVSMLEAKAPATVGLMGRGAAMPANQTPAGWQGMTKPGGQPSAQPAVPTPAEAQASDELTSQAPAMKALPKVAKKRSKLLATLKGKGVVVRVVNTTAEAEAILGKKVSKGRKGVSQNVNGTPHVVLIGEQSVDAMADTLDHEAIHGLSLAFAAEYPELHAAAMLAVDPASPEFDAALNEFMSREYNGYDKLSQRQKFEEALRAIVEGRWKGRTSAKSKGFKKFLKAFLAYVQGLMDGSQNAALKQIVANIEGALKDAPQQQPATQTPPPPNAAGGVGTRNPAFANLSNEELAQRHATAVRLSKESGRTDNASWGYDADLMAKEIEARKAEKQAPPSAKTGTKITQENGQNFAKKIIGKFRQTYPGIAKFFKESDDLLDNEAAGRSGLITVVDPASEATSPTFLILFSPRLIAADHVGYDETTAIKRLLAQLDEEVRHVAALQAAKDVWIQKAADQFKADQSKTLLRLPFDAWHASILANDPKARFMPWLKSHYTEIWNDHFTPEMKEAVMQARATQGAEEPWALALEGYRMLDQLEKTNSITEAVLQDLAALLKVLGDFLGKVSKAAESQIKKEITAIRRILESYGYENGAVKPDAKKKPAKANSAKKPQESAEKEPESPASYLDRVLDAAIKDGMGELTIPVPEKNQNRDDLQKAIEAIEARGLQASTDGKNLLVRGFRELAQAAKTKEAARPAAETKDGAASLKTTPETAPESEQSNSDMSTGAVDGTEANPETAPKTRRMMGIAVNELPTMQTVIDGIRFELFEGLTQAVTVMTDEDSGNVVDGSVTLHPSIERGVRAYNELTAKALKQSQPAKPADPDNGFGLSGPWSRRYIQDMTGRSAQDLAAAEKKARSSQKPTPNVENTTAEAPKAQDSAENAAADVKRAIDSVVAKGFEGLWSAPARVTTAYDAALPQTNLPALTQAAAELVKMNLDEPVDLARSLSRIAPNGALRQYSNRFWRLITSFSEKPLATMQPGDWQAIYAGIDEPAEPITQPPPNESLADVAPISTPEQDAAQEREQLNALPRVARMRAEMAQAFGWEDEQTGWDMARMLERSLQSRTIGYPQRWNNGLNVPMMKMFFREAGIAPVKGWTQKGIKSALEQWRDAAPVAEESSEVAKSGPPSLGTTGKEIWQGWKNLTGTEVMPGEVVVGVDVNNGGVFSWSGDELMRSETNAKAGTALMRPATKAEIEGIHDSIDRGGLQIESRKITGAMGQYPKVDGGKTSKVIHQATGKPLAEWLETDAGKKWLERDEETRRKVAEIGTRADAPPTGLISNEESARLDALSEENMQRFVKLSANQLSQLAIELGVRPMVFQRKGVDQAETLDRTHPDDLKAALDVVTKARADTPATTETNIPVTAEMVSKWFRAYYGGNAEVTKVLPGLFKIGDSLYGLYSINKLTDQQVLNGVPFGDSQMLVKEEDEESAPEVSNDTAPTPTIIPERGDAVTWTDGAGKPATATVDKITERDGTQYAWLEWFGTKEVPLDQLTVKTKSGARLAREKREAEAANIPVKEVTTPEKAKEKKPTDTKALRAMNTYLLEKLDDAIAAAPSEAALADVRKDLVELMGLSDKWTTPNVNIAMAKLREKYNLDPKAKKADIDAAIRASVPAENKVVIEIPGDGTFTLWNDKATLKEFAKVADDFPTKTPKADTPTLSPIRQTGIPALKTGKNSKNSKADVVKVAGMFTSTDETRQALMQVADFGDVLVATNGKMLFTAPFEGFGSAEDPMLYTAKGGQIGLQSKVGDKFEKFPPNWKAVVPVDIPVIHQGIDTGRLWQILKQASSLARDVNFKAVKGKGEDVTPYVAISINQDGSLGVKSQVLNNQNLETYEHNIQQDSDPVGSFDAELFMDALAGMRALGHEKVAILSGTERGEGPIMLTAPNAEIVIMRVKTQLVEPTMPERDTKVEPAAVAAEDAPQVTPLKTQADTALAGKTPQELLAMAAPYEQQGPDYNRNIAESAARMRRALEMDAKFWQLNADELAIRLEKWATPSETVTPPPAANTDKGLYADASRFFASLNSDYKRSQAIAALKSGEITPEQIEYLANVVEGVAKVKGGTARDVAPDLIARLRAFGKPAAAPDNATINALADEIADKIYKQGQNGNDAALMHQKAQLGALIDPDVRLGDQQDIGQNYAYMRQGGITADEFTKWHRSLRSQFNNLRDIEPAFKPSPPSKFTPGQRVNGKKEGDFNRKGAIGSTGPTTDGERTWFVQTDTVGPVLYKESELTPEAVEEKPTDVQQEFKDSIKKDFTEFSATFRTSTGGVYDIIVTKRTTNSQITNRLAGMFSKLGKSDEVVEQARSFVDEWNRWHSITGNVSGREVMVRNAKDLAKSLPSEETAPQAKEPAKAPTRKPRAPKKPTLFERLQAYFVPGAIVDSYGGKDRVIALYPDGGIGQGGWSVEVVSVDKDGKDTPGARVRRHSTLPSEKALQKAWQDRAEAIVRNLMPKEQAGKLNPREREAIDEARMSLASAPAPGSRGSMASESGAAQNAEPSPGGLSEAEWNNLIGAFNAHKAEGGFWLNKPLWTVSKWRDTGDSFYATYVDVLGHEEELRISNHFKPPHHETNRHFIVSYVGMKDGEVIGDYFQKGVKEALAELLASKYNLQSIEDVEKAIKDRGFKKPMFDYTQERRESPGYEEWLKEFTDVSWGFGRMSNRSASSIMGWKQSVTANSPLSELMPDELRADALALQEVLKKKPLPVFIPVQNKLMGIKIPTSRETLTGRPGVDNSQKQTDVPSRGQSGTIEGSPKSGKDNSPPSAPEVNPESSRAEGGTLASAPARQSQMLEQAAATLRGEGPPLSPGLRSMFNPRSRRPETGERGLFDRPQSQLADSIQKAYRAVQMGQSTVMVPIRAVFQRLKAANPALKVEDYLAAIQAADERGDVMLEAANTTAEQQANAPFVVPSQSGPGVRMAWVNAPQESLASAPARSVTAAQDAEYMAAVEAGDMETAQRMVDEAAKAAGFETKAWHGSPDDEFTVFQKLKKEADEDGFWFSKDREWASKFGPTRLFYIKDIKTWGGDDFVVKNPNSIKSADPVTRDEWPSAELAGAKVADLLRGGEDAIVNKGVIPRIHDSQILDPIIKAIPVDVVDMFGSKKAATDVLLNNPSVLQNALSSRKTKPSVGLFNWSGFRDETMSVVTGARTELRRAAASEPAFLNREMFAAVDALQNNLIALLGNLSSQGVGGMSDVTPITLSEGSVAFSDQIAKAGAEPSSAASNNRLPFQELGSTDFTRALDFHKAQSSSNAGTTQGIKIIPLSQRFNPQSDSILYSAPSQNPNKATQAMRDVIEGLPDPHRKVLRDILVNGMSVEDAATTHTLSEAAVINILRRGEAHVRVMMDAKAASPELAVEDGIVKAAYGRPDLARSGDSLMAALDQNRPMPEVVHRAEMEDLAWAMFSGWPTESLAIVKRWMDSGGMMTVPDNLPHGLKVILDEAAARGAAPMLMQVASNHALNEARLNNAPLFEQMRLGLAWRELGIEQGRAFGARQDTFHDPMERHALYIQKMLTMPQDGDLKTLLNNPASRSRILAEMERRAEDMKRRLKAAGYDLDAWFAEQKAVATEAASFMPPAAAPQLKRLPRKVQHGINAWVAGAKLQDAAREAGMTAQELRDAYADFYAAVNQEAIKAASAAKDEMLRSAPAANDFAAQIGLPPPPATADPNARLNDTPKARAYQARRENAALNRPTEVAAAMSEMSAGQSGFIGKMAEYWRMSILSGPQTWVVNASSGLALGMYRNMVQKLGTAGLASIVRATGMADLPNAPALSDIGPVLQHAWDTFVPSLKNAFRSWKHNRRLYDAYAKGNLTLDPGGKDWDFDKSGIVMDGKEVVFKGEKYGPALSRDKWWKPGAIMDVISFRMLLIADEFVRSWFGRIETAAQLRQMARSEPALKKRTEELRAEIKKMLPTAWELRYTNNNGYYAVKPAVVDFIVEEGQNRRVEKRTIMERVEMKEWSAAVPAAKRDSLATNAADLATHGGFDALLTDKATPEQLKARLDRLGKPGSGAWLKGIEAANTITAQSELGTGVRAVDAIDGLADLIQRGKTSKYALVSVPMQFLFPFVATPVNLFKTGITMSPVGGFLALIDAVRSYRSRKAGDLDGARKIMDAARALEEIVNQTVAWGLVLTLSELMEPDDDEEDPKKRLPRFTGTGEWKALDAGERQLAYKTAPPLSFRIGDRWFSYRRLDPFAIALANIADGIDAFKKEPTEKALFTVGVRAIDAMEEKTFLAGAADAMNLIRDPERYGPRWAANIATGFIPNLIRQPVRSADEQFRDKDIPTNAGFWEKLERHIGYSIIPQFGPEKLDLWGRNVEKDTDTFGPLTDTAFRLLSPVGGSVPAPDALDVALYTFNLENPGKGDFGIEAPERRITRTLAGQKIVVDLTDEERANFIRQAGSRAHATVTAQYGGRKLTLEDVDNIRVIVRKVYSVHRDAAFVAAVQKRGGVNSILAKTTK